MWHLVMIFSLLSISTFGTTVPLHAYEESVVPDGAIIDGEVAFTGTPPFPKSFETSKYPDSIICASGHTNIEAVTSNVAREPSLDKNRQHAIPKRNERILREANVSHDGAMGDVVIALRGVKSGKKFQIKHEGVDIESSNCFFEIKGPSPFVGVFVPESPIRFRNSDPTIHRPRMTVRHAGEKSQELVNASLQPGGGTFEFTPHGTGRDVIGLRCEKHEFMQNYLYSVDNPYYAIVGMRDGKFRIEDIPAGNYTLTAWHPKFGQVYEQNVAFEAGERKFVSILYGSTNEPPIAYMTVTGTRTFNVQLQSSPSGASISYWPKGAMNAMRKHSDPTDTEILNLSVRTWVFRAEHPTIPRVAEELEYNPSRSKNQYLRFEGKHWDAR